jgi:hypothetical protein
LAYKLAGEEDSSRKHNFEGQKDDKLKSLIHKSCQDLFINQMRKPAKKATKEERKPKALVL